MDPSKFLSEVYQQLASSLTGNEAIRNFTRNPQLIGMYAEATIRQLIARIVHPLRISRGAIIHEGNCGDGTSASPPEIDAIIWQPCPVPAIFESGDFALIPRNSAVGMLEIKSTNYTDVGAYIYDKLNHEYELFRIPGQSREFKPGSNALGVICLQTGPLDKTLDNLCMRDLAVVMLERKGDDLVANGQGMARLINFLMGIRHQAIRLDGTLRL